VRIDFTPDDLARTRFSAGPAPLVETVLAMVELRQATPVRRRSRIRPWLREARSAFPPTARPLLDLYGPCGPYPCFIGSVAPDLEEALEVVRATPRSYLQWDLADIWQDRPGRPPAWLRDLANGDTGALEVVVRALRDLHDAVVAPRWDSVLAAFHGDVARRMPVLAAGGHQALFGSLHSEVQWRNDGLELRYSDREYELNGRGLVLVPSATWTGRPVYLTGDGSRMPSALAYAAQPNGQASPDGGVLAGVGAADSLASLLGPTRAAVLRALREPRGTADLASTVQISPASASEHAKVLREAYLVETRRAGQSVRHSLTPLGRTMLGQLRPPAKAPGDCPSC
jgi:hypothetical protein